MHINISTFKDRVDPAGLGAAYYLAVANVPAMIVVHILIFVYLLRRRHARAPRQAALAAALRGGAEPFLTRAR